MKPINPLPNYGWHIVDGQLMENTNEQDVIRMIKIFICSPAFESFKDMSVYWHIAEYLNTKRSVVKTRGPFDEFTVEKIVARIRDKK